MVSNHADALIEVMLHMGDLENTLNSASTWEVTSEDALKLVANHVGSVIVDLDETLYLQNSTLNFLDCATPGIIALLLVKASDLMWRLFGGAWTRDIWRVRLILALLPWTLRRWKARCPDHAASSTNRALLAVLNARKDPFIIATNGFYPLVEPLLDAMGLGGTQLIACRLNRACDRRGGKAALVMARIGVEMLRTSLVITDSSDDLDLLSRCHTPCLTKWSGAGSPRPLGRVYLPGLYTAVVKRPGGFSTVLINQMFWLILPLTTGSFNPLIFIAGVLFFWSFWAVYEVGYRDNDICGKKYELEPNLKPQYLHFKQRHFELKAWLFAVIFGALGVWTLSTITWWLTMAVAWFAYLIVIQQTFWLYNRIDKTTRVWLYLVLQLQREAGYLVFAAASPVGLSATIARAMAKWIEYIVYRYAKAGANNFIDTPIKLFRIVIFCVLIAALAVTGLMDTRALVSSAAIFLLFLIIAKGDIKAAVRSARRIDKLGATG